MNVAIVVGNPKPMSRTRTVAEEVAKRVVAATGAEVGSVIDLADHADVMFRWPHEELDSLTAAVAASDYVVFASPTYKAAYTGLLKAFLDRYQTDGLAGVTAIPVMTGGSMAHYLTIDTTLRPLLAELGASTPGRGFYFLTSQMDELPSLVDDWAALNLTMPGRLGPMARQPVVG